MQTAALVVPLAAGAATAKEERASKAALARVPVYMLRFVRRVFGERLAGWVVSGDV